MGPGPEGPMGAMGAMEPHHMNGSLGGFKNHPNQHQLFFILDQVYFKNQFVSSASLRVWGYGWVAKGE